MLIHVFKTNLKTPEHLKIVSPVFNSLPQVIKWTVDTDDIDNVLRIEAFESLQEKDVIHLSKLYGFQCEPLPG